MKSNKAMLVVTALTAFALGGCGDDAKPPPQTADKVKPTAPKADMATPTSGSIQIDDKIIKICGEMPATHFAFDSASIQGEAAKSLEPLAKCFATGPGKGKKLRLTGHTDPRGETEYNFALGQKRAGSVTDFLASKGVEKGMLETTSKGELEASGTDDQGWARDRKVVITLAE